MPLSTLTMPPGKRVAYVERAGQCYVVVMRDYAPAPLLWWPYDGGVPLMMEADGTETSVPPPNGTGPFLVGVTAGLVCAFLAGSATVVVQEYGPRGAGTLCWCGVHTVVVGSTGTPLLVGYGRSRATYMGEFRAEFNGGVSWDAQKHKPLRCKGNVCVQTTSGVRDGWRLVEQQSVLLIESVNPYAGAVDDTFASVADFLVHRAADIPGWLLEEDALAEATEKCTRLRRLTRSRNPNPTLVALARREVEELRAEEGTKSARLRASALAEA